MDWRTFSFMKCSSINDFHGLSAQIIFISEQYGRRIRFIISIWEKSMVSALVCCTFRSSILERPLDSRGILRLRLLLKSRANRVVVTEFFLNGFKLRCDKRFAVHDVVDTKRREFTDIGVSNARSCFLKRVLQ